MLVKVECPFCGNVSRVDPARVGEFIDCPGCRASLNVPNPGKDRDADEKITFENEPPRERRDRPPSRRMWAAAARLMVGGAIVLLILGFVVFQRIQKMQRPMVRRVRPVWPPQQGLGHRRQLPQAGGENRLNVPGNWPGANDDGSPPIPVVWRVVPDPPLEAVAMPPNRVVHLAIPPGPNPEVLFPATPSTMVSVGNVGHGREHREVWDYRANRRVGTTRGLRTRSENLGGYYKPVSALGADGRVFVTQGKQPLELAVWDVARENQIGLLKPEHAPTAGLTFAAFAQVDRLLTCGFGTPFQVLDVTNTSDRLVGSFPGDKEFDHRLPAVSPGGRYVVVFDKKNSSFRFYDIEISTVAGELSWPFGKGDSKACEGVAFSPDGREVAALVTHNGDTALVCWSLGSGLPADQIDFQGNLRTILASPLPYLYAPLEWFPDGKRWLVYGQGIVDRRARKLTSKLPDEPNRWRFGMRHVVGDDCVLSVIEENDHFVLASLRVAPQNVEHAAPTEARADTSIKR
jgi:hypothetical protein